MNDTRARFEAIAMSIDHRYLREGSLQRLIVEGLQAATDAAIERLPCYGNWHSGLPCLGHAPLDSVCPRCAALRPGRG